MERSRSVVITESPYILHILPAEWRWVILAATGLVFLSFAPVLWIALTDTRDWQFMGMLHNYQDGGSYLAKMAQGEAGEWLIRFLHTPEPHNGAFIQVLYPLLGHVARFLSLPTLVVFHVARVGAALFMYLALYHLAASIWQRVRTRRLFFAIAGVGSGFGWLLAPLLQPAGVDLAWWPDLAIPEIVPLYSTFIAPHFPLTLGLLALLASLIIGAFRPGAPRTGGAVIALPLAGFLSLLIALLYPQALAPFAVAFGLYAVLVWAQRRHLTGWAFRWGMALAVPALPLAAYYAALVRDNPAFAEWNRQNATLSPPPAILLLGLGLPLLLAVPAVYRAARQFSQSDDRFMLFWLVAILILMYLPTNVQRRFAAGLMLPVAYFATRAVEDVWFRYVSRRRLAYALVLPLMALSSLLVLFLPVLPVVTGNVANAAGVFLERDYAIVFRWLEPRTSTDDIVLAAPVVGTWIPGWATARVVYGHPYETLRAAEHRAEVEAWYAQATTEGCRDLLERYDVRYVVVGPQERALGPVVCADVLTPMITRGQVSVYAP